MEQWQTHNRYCAVSAWDCAKKTQIKSGKLESPIFFMVEKEALPSSPKASQYKI